jgi:hypothetical protein
MMAKQPTEEPHGEHEKAERQQVNVKIGQHVMQTLGQPGDLQGVQVRRLWKDHFRVNIFVGLDAASAKVAHSYFLVSDNDGNILAATPTITRKYGVAASEITMRG